MREPRYITNAKIETVAINGRIRLCNVLDISANGACLLLSETCLILPDDTVIFRQRYAKVRWQKKLPGATTIGIKFDVPIDELSTGSAKGPLDPV